MQVQSSGKLQIINESGIHIQYSLKSAHQIRVLLFRFVVRAGVIASKRKVAPGGGGAGKAG